MLKPASFLLAAALVASPAFAHPKLVGTVPAANATVAAPSSIALSFNEKIVPRFTGATVTMATGFGAANPVAGFAPTFGGDGKSLKLASAHPLGRGSYKVAWHAVAADTHRVTGGFAFKVK